MTTNYHEAVCVNEKELIWKGELSLISLNVCSVNSSIEKLRLLVKETEDVDVIAIQEVWKPKGQYAIDNFGYLLFKDRKNGNGGGVGFWVKSNLKATEIMPQFFKENTFECMLLEVKTKLNTYVIANIYRPPSGNIKLFLETFEEMIDCIMNEYHKNIIIAGDININLSDEYISEAYCDIINKYALHQYIMTSTRITPKSQTLIDHIITKPLCNYKTGTIICDISDHLATFLIINPSTVAEDRKKKNKEKYTFFTYKKSEIELIKVDLNLIRWTEFFETNRSKTVTELSIALSELLTAPFIKHCRKEKKKFKHKENEWYSRDLKKRKNALDKLHKKLVKNPSAQNEKLYRTAKRSYNYALKAEKKQFYQKKLEAAKNNNKETWKIINTLTERASKQELNVKELVTNPDDKSEIKTLCNKFNDYFINIGSETVAKIKDIDNLQINTPKNCGVMSFKLCTCNDIMDAINTLQPKTSSGADNITNKYLKLIKNEIAYPLSVLINIIILRGEVPQQWKTAKVIPLYKKKGQMAEMTNYRPISLLSSLSKIMEKIVANQIVKHLSQNSILSKSQFGFRKNHNTTHAIWSLVLQLLNGKSNKNELSATFFDLAKAFDIINHNLLMKKLCAYKIDPALAYFLEDYLTERKQFIEINGVRSEIKMCKNIGTIQGSVLGPLLFLIYINEIDTESEENCLLFADDTVVINEGKTKNDLKTNLQNSVQKITDWFASNKLVTNNNKTEIIHFPLQRNKNSDCSALEIKIGNEVIKNKNNYKYLGITIDSALSFSDHIDSVIKKIKSVTFNLGRCAKYLNVSSRLTIYNSLILPHLLYGISVWHPLAKQKKLNQLEKVQKKAIRIINGGDWKCHTEPLFKKFNLLKLNDLAKRELILFLKKWQNVKLPMSLQKVLEYSNCSIKTRNEMPVKTGKYKGKLTNTLLKITQNELKPYLQNNNKNLPEKIKDDLIKKYKTKCSIKACYICTHYND